LIDKINEKYPGLLKNQNMLKASIDEIATAQKEANKALARNIFLEEYKNKYHESQKKVVDAQQKVYEKLWEIGYTDSVIGYSMDKIQNDYEYANEMHNINRSPIPFYRMFADTPFSELYTAYQTNEKVMSQLQKFGNFMGISNAELMNMVNGENPGVAGVVTPTGNGTPLGGSAEAIATGGQRNTTINVSLGKFFDTMVFNGSLSENRQDMERQVEECFMRVLYAAQSAT
jgi:hypothetical protein